jgi:hypothetical protein
LLYLQNALVLSTELNYKKGIAQSFLLQGRAYYYKDDYPLAKNIWKNPANCSKNWMIRKVWLHIILPSGHYKGYKRESASCYRRFSERSGTKQTYRQQKIGRFGVQ